ncbi:MAG: phosphatidylserine decarboxylase [Flavobacteriaceae bacterium]
MLTIFDSIRSVMVPIHREGHRFLMICGAALLLLWFLGSWLVWPVLLITAWVAFFFRDPKRVTPVREGLVISPADGRISSVGDARPPAELGLGDKPLPRVSVFMNVFDCHVNRTPVTGRILKIAYRPGAFLNAELDKASEDNERNALAIETPDSKLFGVVQIAGLVARRIVCFVAEGETITAGDRFGLIRFGSRVDVYMPAGTRPLVAPGQRAVAGETVFADLAAARGDQTVRIS